jgi:polyphosphate kinase
MGMLDDVREYIDRLHIEGHSIGEDHDDDPVLIDPFGAAVDTWRENYPFDERSPGRSTTSRSTTSRSSC